MKAVIMAGGEGTRLRPLTCELPKPLVPIVNRPVMEHIIAHLSKHGIKRIVSTLHYLPGSVRRTFGDGGHLGVELTYEVENEPMGTAGSILAAKEILDEDFIVISGDCLTDIDLTAAVSFHKKRDAVATIILKKVPNPLEYGIVVTDKDGCVTRFLEKPGWGEVFSDTANTGIYILSPSIFNMYPAKEKPDFSKDVFPSLLERKAKLCGFVSDGYWCDIGEPSAYMQANIDALEGKVKINIPGAQIRRGIWAENDVIIGDDVKLDCPCAIGSGCIISGKTTIGKYTVIGSSGNVGNNCRIYGSVIWDGSIIGDFSNITDSLILNGTTIGKNVNIHSGSVIGGGCIIRENSTVYRNVTLWPGMKVSPGTEVKGDGRTAKYAGGTLFGQRGIAGTLNNDITVRLMTGLGAGYGSTKKIGSEIVIATDGSDVAKMLQNALSAGILSAGVNVIDAKTAIIPALRRCIIDSECDGGIFIFNDNIEEDDGNIRIIFLDRNGREIGRSDERKIENIYARGDFRNCMPNEVRSIRVEKDCMLKYKKKVTGEMKKMVEGMSVALCMNGSACDTVWEILEDVGVKVIRADELEAKGCAHYNCILGVIIDRKCEKLCIVDSKGNVVSGDMIYSLAIIIASHFKDEKVKLLQIRVPVTTSSTINDVAAAYGAIVVRTRTSYADLMENINPVQFDICFDPPAGILRMLRFLKDTGMSVDELVKKIPVPNMVKESEKCPWEAKGHLMRTLLEGNIGNVTETKEGVRFEINNGWAILIPDCETPEFHIYAESFSTEASREIALNFKKAVQSIRQNSNP